MEEFVHALKKKFKGDVQTEREVLNNFSHDASLFEVEPKVVVSPKDQEDVEFLVKTTNRFKNKMPGLSLTARSAGTDMSGGPLTNSVVVDFAKYFHQTPQIIGNKAVTKPGVYYRDFEKETLKHGLIFPSYPASKSISAMGGIVNNNAGGEKSLYYGKTENFVKKLRVTLSDGQTYEIKKLKPKELSAKLRQKDFEGNVYRKIKKLILDNKSIIRKAKPATAKNSAGYNLWDIMDDRGNFDLTKLFVGSQGTLGITTEAEIGLVPIKKYEHMVVLYLPNLSYLTKITKTVLDYKPESFEAYDDNTLKLALRYFPEFFKQFGIAGMSRAATAFFPAFMLMLIGKMPKLVVQIGFSGDSKSEIALKAKRLMGELKQYKLVMQNAVGNETDKYWLVRRESFNLLRKKIRGKHTAPFIDDFVIDPSKIEYVLPRIVEILKEYPDFRFTVAGHVGEGNFHIIPIVDIKNDKVRRAIPEIAKKVYEIVTKNGGSITGEHNDGLIRTPYLEMMYGKVVVNLFEEVKNIFDPKNIFNPRKKVGGDLGYAMSHLRKKW